MMIEKMRRPLTILAVLICTIGYGPAFSQVYAITDFVETSIPKVGSKEWYELNYSSNEFEVSADNGTLKVSKADKDRDAILEIESGQLIGSDNGEWGGKIEFLPKGKKERSVVKKGNVKFIFRFNNQIYFIEGLAHLSTASGTMYRLEGSDSSFVPVKVIDFEDAPEAMCILDDDIFVVAHRSFFLIKALDKETVVKDTFWTSLYPNSVAVMDLQNVYIGHRGGYTKLNIMDKELHFFKFRVKK